MFKQEIPQSNVGQAPQSLLQIAGTDSDQSFKQMASQSNSMATRHGHTKTPQRTIGPKVQASEVMDANGKKLNGRSGAQPYASAT